MNGLIGPNDNGGFAISDDDAQSWETYSFGPMGPNVSFFSTIAVDDAGNVYAAGAGGYNPNNTIPDGRVTFAYYNRETGETNAEAIDIPIPEGDALWPWLVAGDDGRVAITWYQTLADDPREFHIYAAVTHNGHGTTVTCEDGSTQFIAPQFTLVNASGRPIHEGYICQQGTGCNAETDFERSDRRLGDFFTINFDKDGDLFIVSGDTMLQNPLGGPKPVANPIFIRQVEGGDRMLVEPRATRPTKCLMDLPTC